MKKRCPHFDIQYCPLYVASHEGRGGCDDGELAQMGCAVDRRKIKYEAAVKKLDAFTVAYCQKRERNAESRAQHERNMRLNGIR